MQVSSTSSQDPGTRPTVSRPMSSVSGCRPVANSASSASTWPPSSRVRVTGPAPPGRRIPVTVTPIRTSTPASARARPTSSPAKGSIRDSRPSAWASRVTAEPRPAQALAISTPTPPPPTMASRPGTAWESVACRLVQGRASARPASSGRAVRLPVQIATACRAVSATVPSSGVFTATRRWPSRRPWPRISSAPRLFSPAACPSSFQLVTHLSRRPKTAGASTVPVTACRAPATRQASATATTGRSNALLGMHAQ